MHTFEIPISLKQLIDSNQAFHYRIIPFRQEHGTVFFKTDTEKIKDLEKELNLVLPYEVVLEQESSDNLQSYLSLNYRKTTSQVQELTETNFLDRLIQTAKEFGSSDIHLEPYEDFCRVRFRLDGKLKEQYNIPAEKYPQLINKIKIRADLDISQKRLSQDGRISYDSTAGNTDIRVSTMPSLYGEKIVLRLLKRNAESVKLEDLGFNKSEQTLYLEAIKQPNGIILISGPTGSGKTTTLYGTLKILNTKDTNIVTIEDPIEYTLSGINQVQLKEDIGFDFPTALRTFLRQDPDIIMVGEIRDQATANMAIKAALTGHLVLSTIHTNSAWATISRLIDMGIPPYLLASTIKLTVAQRLVRKLCNACKKEDSPTAEDFPSSFTDYKNIKTHYKAVGCPKCYFTGYSGRKAIYEVIPINKALEIAIKDNQLQIDEYLANQNILSLKQNAIRMVKSGETSIEEVFSLLTN